HRRVGRDRTRRAAAAPTAARQGPRTGPGRRRRRDRHHRPALAMLTLATSSLFSTGHIALTAAISGVLAAAVGLLWLRGEHRALDSLALGVLSAAAVFLLRKSANMPQLNDDGLSGFSANDWLAPTVTYVVLGVYGALRP